MHVEYKFTETEVWKDIKGYEGYYQISNKGRIHSLNRTITDKRGFKYKKKGKELKPHKGENGYIYISLKKNNFTKTFTIHRLVATYFTFNPLRLPEVNHIDENKENNKADNLEWCTHKYNNSYGTKNSRAMQNRDSSYVSIQNKKRLSKKVFQYDFNNNLIRIWPSTQECQRNGFSQGCVAACCRGEYKQYYGYKWSYERRDSFAI